MLNKLIQLNAHVIVPLKHYGLKISGLLADASVMKMIIDRGGDYEPHATSYISCILKEGDTFVDIGANMGYFTMIGSKLVGKSGKVLAFEPLTINMKFLEQNLKLNNLDTDSNVACFQYGIWNEDTYKEVNFNRNLGITHITSPDCPGYHQDQKETIHCIPFDSFNEQDLGKIKLIKMDVEGAEPFALMGMRRTIEEHRPIMVIELNRDCLRKYFKVDSDSIWNQLKELGYEIYTFFENKPITKMLTLEQLNSVCPANNYIDLIALPQG